MSNEQRRQLFALIRDHGLKYIDVMTLLLDPSTLTGVPEFGVDLLQAVNRTTPPQTTRSSR